MRLDSHFVALVALWVAGCSSSSSGGKGQQNQDAGQDSGAASSTEIDRSKLPKLTSGSLDYSDPNYWVCRPGNVPNECHDDLTATELEKDLTRKAVPRPPAAHPAFDCFYVYPTVSLTGSGNVTDFTDPAVVDAIKDPLLSQGAPFASLCEVYAPLYRQASLGGAITGDAGIAVSGAMTLGFQDVEDAFDYFLTHLSHGRNFVLLGHSQGTFALTKLIQDKIDGDAALRSRMISALLIGGNVTVPTGAVVGGSFQSVPLCTTPGQTGCVIAYNTFAKEAPPGDNAVFGKAPAGSETACTAPGPLANNPGRFSGSYTPLDIYQPLFKPDLPADGTDPTDITTPFALYRDFFRGACFEQNGAHYLEVSIDKTADDQRPTPKYRSAATEAIGFGLHVSDYNLALDDLLEAVKLQAAAMKP